jgi:hypothetical protein
MDEPAIYVWLHDTIELVGEGNVQVTFTADKAWREGRG